MWKFFSGLTKFNKSKVIFSTLREDHDLIHKCHCAFESQQVELCDYFMDGLGHIKLYSKIISSSDFMGLGYIISNVSQPISVIRLRYCKWDTDAALALSSMATNDSISVLEFADNEDSDQFIALSYLLSQLPNLQDLYLNTSSLTRSQVESLTRDLILPQLKILRIQIPLAPTSHPEQVLKSLTFGSHNITQVFLQGKDSSDMWKKGDNFAMWKKWVCYAFEFQVFQESDVSWVHLYNSDTFSSLSSKRFSYFTDVSLVNCNIGDEGAEVLANNLNSCLLEALVLDFNRISNAGAVALSGCLSKCIGMKEVSIQCNSISDTGAIELANSLTHCNGLRNLDLQGNSVYDKGALVIAETLANIPGLDLYFHNEHHRGSY